MASLTAPPKSLDKEDPLSESTTPDTSAKKIATPTVTTSSVNTSNVNPSVDTTAPSLTNDLVPLPSPKGSGSLASPASPPSPTKSTAEQPSPPTLDSLERHAESPTASSASPPTPPPSSSQAKSTPNNKAKSKLQKMAEAEEMQVL